MPISLLPRTAMLGDLGWVPGPQWVSASQEKSVYRHERPGSQGEIAWGSPPNLGTSLPSAGCGPAGGQRGRLRGKMGDWPFQMGQERTLPSSEKGQEAGF